MNIPAPHFLLFSEAKGKRKQGQWKFVLQAADGSATFEAEDSEPDVGGERLELLAVIRGLEALDQPSRVTLFTSSKYVNRGIAYGLEEWRRNDWTWECFGEMVPVKNRDLWRRLDQALNYHSIEFRVQRTDEAHHASAGHPPEHARLPHPGAAPFAGELRQLVGTNQEGADSDDSTPITVKSRSRHGRLYLGARFGRSLREGFERWKVRCGQLGTALLPKPWM
ncbi:MAG TPA: RNase H family protein [Pirellulales bacterium]|nr:RNase H family protein [Pirellulales bacterium]